MEIILEKLFDKSLYWQALRNDVMDRLCDTINDLTKKNGKKYHIKRLDRTYKILQFLKGININDIKGYT